jgi:hypothetical protein
MKEESAFGQLMLATTAIWPCHGPTLGSVPTVDSIRTSREADNAGSISFRNVCAQPPKMRSTFECRQYRMLCLRLRC